MTLGRPVLAAGLALAWVLLGSLSPGLPTSPVPVRAGGGLATAMDATYLVQPDQARVHVVVDAVSTSYEADTPSEQIYYTGLTVSVPPGSSNIAVTSGGVPLSTTVSPTATQTNVQIGFSASVFYLQSYAYRITFDMVDQGGEASRDLRIGRSVVAFPVWAFGTQGVAGNSVLVVLPAQFVADVFAGPMTQSQGSDGSVRLSAEVTNPAEWYAYITAERPGIFTQETFTLDVGGEEATVIILAWDDDPAWGDRTRTLMTDGLPVLQEIIGLAWPVFGQLRVEESANRLGDYAGIYTRLLEKINVRYDADAVVTLHEAAHIWFNDTLFDDRWIGEAWAEFYAVQSAEQIGATGDTIDLTDDLLAVQFPLNDWADPGIEDEDVELFAYAATYHLAGLIFERTDLDGLRTLWSAMRENEMSYQPVHDSGAHVIGASATQRGWQRLLDLLEERTEAAYDDLWLAWVVNPSEAAQIADRADTRERYFDVVEAAADWELPEKIRYDLSTWRFDEVQSELEEAEAVLDRAADVSALAEEMDLVPPDDLRVAFEGAGGLDDAQAEADAELAALELIEQATFGLAADQGIVETVGLLFSTTDAELALAQDAWQAGDSDAAADQAQALLTTLDEADDRGRERLLVSGGVVVLVGAGGAVAWRRRRRRSEAPGSDEPPAPASESDLPAA